MTASPNVFSGVAGRKDGPGMGSICGESSSFGGR
ncbi:hypothetical protein Mal15_12250 [Stieleria maiorica]|uniref:Uncharacterized protein n=1 Tax=Stieleria maiorica TaxID=2795974 RepID=A0A5B9MD62_9BACT|nr:hypothetical protein Mal15_12250 [Stieleria maiorica]